MSRFVTRNSKASKHFIVEYQHEDLPEPQLFVIHAESKERAEELFLQVVRRCRVLRVAEPGEIEEGKPVETYDLLAIAGEEV